MYDSWDTEWDKQKIFVILGDFLLFYFTNDPEKQNFEKTLKRPNMNILHTCTLNDNHLMDGSWGMGCGGQNFLSFWTIFCFFAQLTTQKLKLKKKMKTTVGDIIILLHMCSKSYNYMIYSSWDIVRSRRTDRRKKWYIEAGEKLKIIYYICIPKQKVLKEVTL